MEQTASPVAQALRSFWRVVTLNRKVTAGFVVVGFFVLLALFGPLLAHQAPTAFSDDILASPSAAHWLGTTLSGQDVLAQVVDGARASMALGFIAGAITTIISVAVGLISGYYGGWLDEIFQLATNVFLVLPTLPLAILLAVYLPFNGTLTLGIVIVVTGWSWGARVLRAQTLSMCNRDYVEAARARGEGSLRIIFFEIFPNEIWRLPPRPSAKKCARDFETAAPTAPVQAAYPRRPWRSRPRRRWCHCHRSAREAAAPRRTCRPPHDW